MDDRSGNRGYSNYGYLEESQNDTSGNFSFGIQHDWQFNYRRHGHDKFVHNQPAPIMNDSRRFVPHASDSTSRLPDVNCSYEMNNPDSYNGFHSSNFYEDEGKHHKFKKAVPKYVQELWNENDNPLPLTTLKMDYKYDGGVNKTKTQQNWKDGGRKDENQSFPLNVYSRYDAERKFKNKKIDGNDSYRINQNLRGKQDENRVRPAVISSYDIEEEPYDRNLSYKDSYSIRNQNRLHDEMRSRMPYNNKPHSQNTDMYTYKIEDISSVPGPSTEFPILDIRQSSLSQSHTKQNWINSFRGRKYNRSENIRDIDNSSESIERMNNLLESYTNKPFQTMRDARRIAEQLGMEFDDDDKDSQDELDDTDDSEMNRFQDRIRKCWAKYCWSTKKHSHAIENIERRHFGDLTKSYSSKRKLDQSQQKMKQNCQEFWNILRSPFLLWNNDLKHIEGHYGTGIVSFFFFLRWLIYLNLLMTVLIMAVIIVPEILFTVKEMNPTNEIIILPFLEKNNLCMSENLTCSSYYEYVSSFDSVHQCSSNYSETIQGYNSTLLDAFQHVLQGTGFMELTPMFIGWYKPTLLRKFKPYYELSEAYIFVTICYFLLCLIMMVSYTRESVRENVLKTENQLQKYCNIIFTSWDFSIEDKKLAGMKHNYLFLKIKVHLAENRRLKEISNWSTCKKISVTILRIAVNVVVIAILCGASYLIYKAIMLSLKDDLEDPTSEGFHSFWTEYRTSVIITAINLILPFVFNFLSSFESYSESFRIKITLIRCVFTRLASVGVLIVSLHTQISCDPRNHCGEGYDKCQTPMCWETYVGQQIYKLSLLDFVVVLITTFLIGFPRKLLVTKIKCKLLQFIGKEEFDISQNVLGLVYSQTLCWLGAFYCPILPLLSVIKYFIFYYVKKFSLVVNCGQSKESYRASRSNTFFMIVLMMSYLIGLFPLIYSLTELETSKGCSPFRIYGSAWTTMVHLINKLPNWVNKTIGFIGSAGFGIPAFMILSLLLYYYLTLSATYSQLSNIMKDHLQTESRDKNFLLRKLMLILHHPQK
ncbi:transmembrane channel-like protein 7 isoform X1 [Centruroides sculpturatus]|uniref:transmembrane channel-like protein 7 isoform X1 n=1 Tax=Centruroides sculpturatus TaxID=218467 RepID=UPI000C6E2018|nr:transmembrane channel-like protein 7 isoform X1 [Centruroides sculpturatus]